MIIIDGNPMKSATCLSHSSNLMMETRHHTIAYLIKSLKQSHHIIAFLKAMHLMILKRIGIANTIQYHAIPLQCVAGRPNKRMSHTNIFVFGFRAF